MINWYRVTKLLQSHVPFNTDDVNAMLKYLYEVEGLSIEQIRLIVKDEVISPISIRNKLMNIGIKLRSKGGKNSTKLLSLTSQQFVENSARELAKKYGVNVSTIYSRKRMIKKEDE